ncbi:MAG: ankyrin repeat domain-containing protein [Flavobacteriales bacterium]|nr:ankyrin repeat domain-containing protein [Flavobacteriales bacterium]
MIFFYHPFDENMEMKVSLKKGAYFVGIYSHNEVITVDEEVLTLHYYHLPDHYIDYEVSKDHRVRKTLVAVSEKNVKAVDAFEDVGGDRFSDNIKLQKQTQWPIDLEKKINQSGMKKLLTKIKAEDPNKIDLQEAIVGGSIEALEHIYSNHPEVFKLKDDYDETFYDWLMITVENNRLSVLKWLFEHPELCIRESNKKAQILLEACKKGNQEIIDLLLEQDYNINQPYISKAEEYTVEYDPLEALIKRSLKKLVNHLYEKEILEIPANRFERLVGATTNDSLWETFLKFIPEDHKQEYLNKGLIGASYGSFLLIDKFLDAGADINYVDEKGMTAVCCALVVFKDTNLNTLLEKGADRNLGTINGQSPKEFANSSNSLPKYAEILNS